MRWRCGVEARRAAAGVEHSQREALCAMAEVIASCQQIAWAEEVQVLVDLENQVVAVVEKRRGERRRYRPQWPGVTPQGLRSNNFWMTGLMIRPPTCKP